MLLPRESNSPSTTIQVVGSEFGTTPDTKPEARLDGLGIWYLTFAGVWTALVLAGMVFLWRNRNTPTLRMRGLVLTFTGIVFLHFYWATVQTGYTIGPLAPEVAEYWIMSIWYPFGIAMFQAANSQFLHVAQAQSRFACPPSVREYRLDEKRRGSGRMTLMQRVRRMEYSRRVFLLVVIGMAVQLLVVVVIYLISRKFHSGFGITGTEVTGSTPMEVAMKQGRGWEWWPSIVWQFVWAWIVAPIILWRSRGIRDTHGWQIQTIACCIAGLPAAPMWLIALYVPGMVPVNRYWIPPQWIAVTIFIMEIFTIFVPAWQVLKHQTLRQETLESIANWETEKRLGLVGTSGTETASDRSSSGGAPLSLASTKVGVADAGSSAFDSWKRLPGLESGNSQHQPIVPGVPGESVMTMAALEYVLERNPEPLREFSARRDFSGENIAFLSAVAEWKASLPVEFVNDNPATVSDSIRRELFTRALRIYIEFVSPRDAEFPINLAWTDLRKLQDVFERAARSLDNDDASSSSSQSSAIDAAVPFATVDDVLPHPPNSARPLTGDSELHILDPSANHHNHPSSQCKNAIHFTVTTTTITTTTTESHPDPSLFLYTGDIPASFNSTVFDAAQASIKYLVLTNTWPKYVRERRSCESSLSGHKSVFSSASASPSNGQSPDGAAGVWVVGGGEPQRQEEGGEKSGHGYRARAVMGSAESTTTFGEGEGGSRGGLWRVLRLVRRGSH